MALPEIAAQEAGAASDKLAAAKQLAQDLGVLLKEDAAGNVVLLDTAAKRSWVDDYQLQELLVFPHLQSLTVEGPSVSDVIMPQIGKLTELSSLAMRNTLITNESLAELKPLKTLRIIDLRVSPLLNDSALNTLAEMQPLRAVRLLGVNISDRGVIQLLKLPQLSELDVRNCRGVTKTGIEALVGKTSLKTLKLGGGAMGDETLAVVARLNQVTTLSLDNCPITDQGLAGLAKLPLVDLTIYQCTDVTDEGLGFLRSLQDLKRLTLRDTKAKGACLALVPHPEKLLELNLAQSGLTDVEAVGLARFTKLEELVLSETGITDSAVETLKELTSLKSLTVAQTSLTEQGLRRLTDALPKCVIRTL